MKLVSELYAAMKRHYELKSSFFNDSELINDDDSEFVIPDAAAQCMIEYYNAKTHN